MFGLFKKKEEGVPDVGGEISDGVTEVNDFDKPSDDDSEEEKEKEETISKKSKSVKKKKEDIDEESDEEEIVSSRKKSPSTISTGKDWSLDFERINARLESVNELMKGYSERFSNLSEQIGEVRSMAVTNEKEISKSIVEGAKAVDMVKEVQPDKFRLDIQKQDMRITELLERIESNKQYMDTLMNEVKELKRKESVFIGTDALLKMNEDVKKDLIELQRLSARVKVNADKSEQLFIELKEGFAENQKVKETIADMSVGYSELQKRVEKAKLDSSNLVKSSDFDEFKKTFNNRFAVVKQISSDLEQIKEENERLANIIEAVASISKANKDNIDEIAIHIGDDNITKVSDYDNQLASILSIIDKLAGEVVVLKSRVGLPSDKIPVSHDEKIIGDDKLNMKNLDVSKEIHDNLSQTSSSSEKDTDKKNEKITVEDSSKNKSSENINKDSKKEEKSSDVKVTKTDIFPEVVKKDGVVSSEVKSVSREMSSVSVKDSDKIVPVYRDDKYYSEQITSLIVEGRTKLRNGDLKEAADIYQDIQEIYPLIKIEDKELYKKILAYYKKLAVFFGV